LNFSKLGEDPIQALVGIEAARKQAQLFMSLGIKSYSQWFEGERNQVSDDLSCNEDRSNEELTRVLKFFCPSQLPSHFKIQPLPREILLKLAVLLLELLMKA
jgi:hypothetical protein